MLHNSIFSGCVCLTGGCEGRWDTKCWMLGMPMRKHEEDGTQNLTTNGWNHNFFLLWQSFPWLKERILILSVFRLCRVVTMQSNHQRLKNASKPLSPSTQLLSDLYHPLHNKWWEQKPNLAINHNVITQTTNLICLSPSQHWHKACGCGNRVRITMLCAHTPWMGNRWWNANDTNACDNQEFFRHDPTTRTKTGAEYWEGGNSHAVMLVVQLQVRAPPAGVLKHCKEWGSNSTVSFQSEAEFLQVIVNWKWLWCCLIMQNQFLSLCL